MLLEIFVVVWYAINTCILLGVGRCKYVAHQQIIVIEEIRAIGIIDNYKESQGYDS